MIILSGTVTNSTLQIGGKTIHVSSSRMEIDNEGHVFLDGKDITSEEVKSPTSVVVNGNIDYLETESGNVEVHGNVGTVVSHGGNITADTIQGDAIAWKGNISTGKVDGVCRTVEGIMAYMG